MGDEEEPGTAAAAGGPANQRLVAPFPSHHARAFRANVSSAQSPSFEGGLALSLFVMAECGTFYLLFFMAEKGTAGDAPAPSGTGARDSSQSPLVVAPVRSLSRRHLTIPRVSSFFFPNIVSFFSLSLKEKSVDLFIFLL